MDKLRRFLFRNTPPGINTKPLVQNFWGGIGLMLGTLIYFLFLLFNDINYISYNWQFIRDLSNLDPEHKMMKPYDFYFRFIFLTYAIGVCAMLIVGASQTGYYFVGSKSIYVMRRVRSAKFIYLQCWTVPLLAILVFTILVALFYFGFLAVYLNIPPAGAIPSQTFAFLWRYVPWLK